MGIRELLVIMNRSQTIMDHVLEIAFDMLVLLMDNNNGHLQLLQIQVYYYCLVSKKQIVCIVVSIDNNQLIIINY